MQTCCDFCAYNEYDEEDEEYYCSVNMDEDDMARFIQSDYRECPFYKSGTAQHIVCESSLTSRGSTKHYFQSKTQSG